MCYKVECKACGKTGWGGCGKHLVPLYNGIQKGSHCLCRSWPGVVAVAPVPSSASLEQPASNQLKDVDQPPPPPPPAAGSASGSVATATAGSAGAEVKIA
ncbi:unnamed protein product [Linum tenue]|uniref:Uncharacterized protein n=1 Tax=Linum tenue TaxID=586396 RepID=A0AAV0R9N5_9ROSI|nr:unnamed protein product [Linum tenue]